jgi:hypothetical protein
MCTSQRTNQLSQQRKRLIANRSGHFQGRHSNNITLDEYIDMLNRDSK